jgi:RNA polymerase sigma factor (sigma-70 family)
MQRRLTGEEQRIVEQNLKLINFVLKSMKIKYEYEDCFSAGCIGLCSAATTWNENQGVAFSTYACHIIKHEIINYLKSNKSSNYKLIEQCEGIYLYEEKGYKNLEDKQLAQFILSNFDKFLDKHEAEVMCLFIKGIASAEIAKLMGIDVFTVYNLRKSAAKKAKYFAKI